MHVIYQRMDVFYSAVKASDVCVAAHVKQPTRNETPNGILMHSTRALLFPTIRKPADM